MPIYMQIRYGDMDSNGVIKGPSREANHVGRERIVAFRHPLRLSNLVQMTLCLDLEYRDRVRRIDHSFVFGQFWLVLLAGAYIVASLTQRPEFDAFEVATIKHRPEEGLTGERSIRTPCGRTFQAKCTVSGLVAARARAARLSISRSQAPAPLEPESDRRRSRKVAH